MHLYKFPGRQVLGKEEDPLIKKVREAQLKLPPTRIARDGSIMEWVCEYFDISISSLCAGFICCEKNNYFLMYQDKRLLSIILLLSWCV